MRVVIASPVDNGKRLRIVKQIQASDGKGGFAWADAGVIAPELASGEMAIGEFANDHHRYVIELAPEPEAAAKPDSWFRKVLPGGKK